MDQMILSIAALAQCVTLKCMSHLSSRHLVAYRSDLHQMLGVRVSVRSRSHFMQWIPPYGALLVPCMKYDCVGAWHIFICAQDENVYIFV